MSFDRRKTAVNVRLKKDLNTLNKYISDMGFLGYNISVDMSESIVNISGSGSLGDTCEWKYNSIPLDLLDELTYADWIDLMISLS